MKAILLVRVSTKAQDFDEQEREIYNMAIKDGYSPECIIPICEKESGIKLAEEERAGLNKMKELIEEDSDINCVYCWEVSRIARRKKINFSVLDYLITHKIQLVVKNPSIRLFKDNGDIDEGAEIVFTLFSQMAESEMRTKLARWKRTKDAKRREGTYVGGWILYGYRVDEKTKKLVINEEEAEIVREIYSMYLSGEHSYVTIAKEMKERGVYQSLRTARCAVGKILRNTAYAGLLSSDFDKTIKTEGNVYPPIVSLEMIEKAKSINEINAKALKKKHTEVFYGKGILRCPDCNAVMRVRKDYLTYTCQNPDCNNTNYYQANLIDAILWYQGLLNYVFNWTNTSENDSEKIKLKLQKIEKKFISNDKEKQAIIQSLDRLEERIIFGRITSEKAANIEEKLNKDLKEIEKTRQQLISEKAAIEANLKALDADEIMNMNELLKIKDNEKRYEIIKDNVEKATIQRLNTQISKILIYLKPKFDYEYKGIPHLYYLNTQSSIVYTDRYNIDKPETDIENQECIIKIGNTQIHKHKEGSHKAKEYAKMKNREYQQSHKAERAEYMRKFRAKQKALKNQSQQPD